MQACSKLPFLPSVSSTTRFTHSPTCPEGPFLLSGTLRQPSDAPPGGSSSPGKVSGHLPGSGPILHPRPSSPLCSATSSLPTPSTARRSQRAQTAALVAPLLARVHGPPPTAPSSRRSACPARHSILGTSGPPPPRRLPWREGQAVRRRGAARRGGAQSRAAAAAANCPRFRFHRPRSAPLAALRKCRRFLNRGGARDFSSTLSPHGVGGGAS